MTKRLARNLSVQNLLAVLLLAGAAHAAPDPLGQAVKAYLAGADGPALVHAHDVHLYDFVNASDEPFTEKPTVVSASRIDDATPVGPYGQPEWTTQRRFLTTRAYVLPQGTAELETWWRGKWPDGSGPEHRLQQELAIGLPHRIQLDLYETLERPAGGSLDHAAVQAEVRWAFADWGKIPLNPTIYLEWVFADEAPDKVEAKLLLAHDFTPRWHWAGNLTCEQETSGEKERELAISQGLSYSLVDGVFAVGAEFVIEQVTVAGARGDGEYEVLLGPSLEVRPSERTHLSFVPLFGLSHDAPTAEVFAVFSFELTKPAKPTFGRSPAANRSN